MSDTPEDAINIDRIIKELQASFGDDRYSFRNVVFKDDADQDAEMTAWHDEMSESWKQLVLHTMEIWDYGWRHSYDHPCKKRTEWIFRRKESPFLNCGVADCLRVVTDAAFMKPKEIEEFYGFIHAALAQGSTMWSYDECKNETEMEKPESA